MKGKNQFLVGFNGSLENMTVVQQPDGYAVVKGKITTMTNPNTVPQQNQRGSFLNAVQTGKTLLQFIGQYFEPYKVTHSPFNSFVSMGTTTSPASTKWIKRKALRVYQYTNGPVYQLPVADDVANPPGLANGVATVSFIWPYDPNSAIQNGDDQVHFLWIDENGIDWNTGYTGFARDDAGGSAQIPVPAAGERVVTIFAVDPNTGKATNSFGAFRVLSDGSVSWDMDPAD